jgi:hypothetical protein
MVDKQESSVMSRGRTAESPGWRLGGSGVSPGYIAPRTGSGTWNEAVASPSWPSALSPQLLDLRYGPGTESVAASNSQRPYTETRNSALGGAAVKP